MNLGLFVSSFKPRLFSSLIVRDEGQPRLRSWAAVFVIDLVRYGFVSVAALACDYGLLIGLKAAGLYYLAASAISFSAGIVVAYLLSTRFVFADRRGMSALREATGFCAVGIAGLLLTQVLLFVLVSGLSLDVAVAKIPTAVCVFVFNFLARRSLVFAASHVAYP